MNFFSVLCDNIIIFITVVNTSERKPTKIFQKPSVYILRTQPVPIREPPGAPTPQKKKPKTRKRKRKIKFTQILK